MNLTIDVNVNLPGLVAFFSHLKGTIVDQLQTLTAKVDELVASNNALAAKVEEANGKQDALIVVANSTKDALVAIQQQGQIDVSPLITKLQSAIDANAVTTASITAQEGQTDAATTSAAA